MAHRKKSLGPGFGEEVVKTTARRGKFYKEDTDDWTDSLLPNFHPGKEYSPRSSGWRMAVFGSVCLILFFIIFLRLFHLQIVEGRANKDLADSNRIQIKIIHAPRGVIFDRNGVVLAANSPIFRLNDPGSARHRVTFVDREQALAWEVRNDPRFASLEIDNIRTYPKGEEFAHLLGYIGEIAEDQLQKQEFRSYRPGDTIGKTGVEAEYERALRGKDGGEIIEVDSLGRSVRTLRREPAIPGQNIYLSVDAGLQEKLYHLMTETLSKSGSCCGAAVAEDPGSGQILAMLSFPSFDPNIFTRNEDENSISGILAGPYSPILNRAIAGVYPPGSTFKIISALAALSSGKISPETVFEDTGEMYLGPYRFTNWYFNQYGKTEGPVNLTKALQRSNDTYFYKVSQIIGEKPLADWARKLRIGSKLNIDLPGEGMGLVPDNDWKEKTYHKVWYPGDTLHMAIGQGFVLATPLQILGITSYIASLGTLYQPEVKLAAQPKILVSGLLSREKITLIKKGLELVPKTGGTAWPFFTFPILTAGKTGTAEYGDPKARTHAWYTSFAPVDNPKIALTIVIEGGGEGSSVAAPIAKEAYRWYLSTDKNKLIQDIYTPATSSASTLGE